MTKLGIGEGVDLTTVLPNRRNTLSSFDFAYWATTFTSEGTPSNYESDGPELNAVSLISWALSQIGINVGLTYSDIDEYCLEGRTTVELALKKRGALLFSGTDIAVTLGLGDILHPVHGRHFIHKPSLIDLPDWQYGAIIPLVDY